MYFGESKVYFDGSHYIAIPHTTRPDLRRTKKYEETVNVVETEEGVEILKVDAPSISQNEENEIFENLDKNEEKSVKNSEKTVKIVKKLKKKKFLKNYMQSILI